jgi:hypothetical protein
MPTIVLGAQKVMNKAGMRMFDKKHRPVWKMPKPYAHVPHAIDCVAGLRYKRTGERSGPDAQGVIVDLFRMVPVYRGTDGYLHKKKTANNKRRAAGRWCN